LNSPSDTSSQVIETDAVVVGAGPVGLFQVFELGLLEIRAHVVDSLPCAGGQCIELYPDKPIYDIPALPRCTGRELTERLLEQIRPFAATFHFGQEVSAIEVLEDGRFDVETNKGTRLLARTVIVAGGVGSFQARTVKVEGLEEYLDTQLFYRVHDAAQFAGQDLVVLGGGDAALERALEFAQDGPQRARSVLLLHRRDVFTAAPDTVARLRERIAAGAIRFVAGQPVGIDEADGRLTALRVTGSDGANATIALDRLLVCLGLSPKLGPIAQWGLGLERKQIVVDTEKFESSTPGIFAVGDINTYPGKKKLILCGFHEATLAAFAAAAYVYPDQRVQLQYTTTSTRLHKVLGVESPTLDD
jgi:thioredoxin reductase (NADPH)